MSSDRLSPQSSKNSPDQRDENATELSADDVSGEELLVEEVSIDGMCGVY